MFYTNQIEQLECNICFDDKSLSDLIETPLTEFFKSQVPETIDEIIESLHIHDLLTIDNINLDLGAFEYTDYQDNSKRKLRNLLEEEILNKYRKAIDNAGGGQKIILQKNILMERMKYYLIHGYFSWEYTSTNYTNPEKLILEIIENHAEEFKLFLKAKGKDENIRKRVVNLLSPQNYYKLIEKLDPENAEYYINYSKDIQKIQHRTGSLPCSDKNFRELTWLLILSHILVERGSYFNQKQFVKWMIKNYAARFSLEFYKLMAVLKDQCRQLINIISCGTNLIKIIDEIDFETKDKPDSEAQEKKSERLNTKLLLAEYEAVTNVETKNNLLKKLGVKYITENYSRSLLKILLQQKIIKRIIKILEPANAGYVCDFSDTLTTTWRKEKFVKTYELEFEETKWETIFKILFADRGSVFNKKEFVKNTLKKMAGHYNTEYLEIVKTICTLVEKIQLNKSVGELFLILGEIGNDYKIEIRKKENSYETLTNCLRIYETIIDRLKGICSDEKKSITESLKFLSEHNSILFSKLKNKILTDPEISKKILFAFPLGEAKSILKIFWEYNFHLSARESLAILKNLTNAISENEREYYNTLFFNLLRCKNIYEVKDIIAKANCNEQNPQNDLCEFVKSIIARVNYKKADLLRIKNIFTNPAISNDSKIISVMEILIEAPEFLEKFISVLNSQEFLKLIKKILPLYNKETEWKVIIELAEQIFQQRNNFLSRESKTKILVLLINTSNHKSFKMFFDLLITNMNIEEEKLFATGLKSEVANIRNSCISNYLSSANFIAREIPRVKQESIEWQKQESNKIFTRLMEIFLESPDLHNKNTAGEMVAYLLEKETNKTKEFFKNILINKKLVNGSIRELRETHLCNLLKLLNPYYFDVIYYYSEIVWQAVLLQPALTGIINYKQAKWEMIFEYMAVLRNNVFSSNKFLKWLIENLGRKQSAKSKEEFTLNIYERIFLLDVEGVIKNNKTIIEDIKIIAGIEKAEKRNNKNTMTKKTHDRTEKGFEDSVYVNNAGIILTAPFLPRLFDMLDYTTENVFSSVEKQHRAANLLQYIIFRDPEYYEHEILINKIMCGLPVEEAVDTKYVFSEEEKNTVEDLLKGIIANWNGLGSVSIDGFRETFLVREGKLTLKDNGWHLHVQQRAFDVLMDRLPWSIAITKLPWMNKAIYTDWR